MGWQCLTSTPLLAWSPANIRINFTYPETRRIVLPDGENQTIVPSFVWTQYRNMTDGRRDRNGLASTAARHSERCRRAIKTLDHILFTSDRQTTLWWRLLLVGSASFSMTVTNLVLYSGQWSYASSYENFGLVRCIAVTFKLDKLYQRRTQS